MVEHSLFQGIVRDTKYLTPLSKGVGLPESRDKVGGGSVVAILLDRDPSTISGGISVVIINAIDG